MKRCCDCKLEKNKTEFHKSTSRPDGLAYQCKECANAYKRKNRSTPKAKKKLVDASKEYNSKPETKQKNRKRWLNYIEKPKVKENRNNKRRQRRKNPIIKLKEIMSRSMIEVFQRVGKSKAGQKFLDLTGYTAIELITHIESLWEPWMNWENFGTYKINTKTWQIDHIYPISKLPFKSQEDDEFKFVNSLCNLRPLDSKQNREKSNKITQEAIDLFEKWKLENGKKI